VMRGMDHLGPVKRAAEFNERVLSFIADVDTPQQVVGRRPRRTVSSARGALGGRIWVTSTVRFRCRCVRSRCS
jgi:hypothetical protein